MTDFIKTTKALTKAAADEYIIFQSKITDIFIYLLSFVFVYIGFNLLLPLVFDFIPYLSCGKVFILALAIDFISMPIRIELEIFISNKFEGV